MMEPTFEQSVFQSIKKIKLISNNICYGPAPKPDEELEQRLTTADTGAVWLTHYALEEKGWKRKLAGCRIKCERTNSSALINKMAENKS